MSEEPAAITSGRRNQRRGGRQRSQASRPSGTVAQTPRRQPRRPFAPLKLVSDDEIEAIHEASLQVLEEIGMDFLLADARERLRAAGADVCGERVRLERGLVEQALSSAPSAVTLHARNPQHSIEIGGDWMAFGPVSSAPNCSDLDGGRRPGTRADYRKFLKLAQYFNCIHYLGGYPVEPIDLHPATRHLDALSDAVRLTDKPLFAYSLGYERITDGIEIARISRGITAEQLEREPSLLTVVNTNSPLKLDEPMLKGIIEMASRNQIVCVTPFTLSGAMAPATVAGALVQQNAEALAGLALVQLVRPGAPMIYGGFTSNVDMKSGAPAFGTPEYMQSTVVGGQLARRYGIPFRTSNTCAANAVDAQAAYESVFSLWGLTMGGGHLIMHGAGWMEGGLVASFEKFALDCDLIQMVQEFLQPLEMTPDALGLDAIREVGPGGHFFGAQHTLARYGNAFYAPMLSDWRNFEQWMSTGHLETQHRANRLWKEALDDYEQPPLDPGIAEELETFVEHRREQGGAPTDF